MTFRKFPAVTAAVLVIGLTGCGGSNDPTTPTGGIGSPDSEEPQGTSAMVLPIEAYKRSFEEGIAINQAVGRLTQVCMDRYGFDYEHPAPPTSPPPPFVDRRYAGVYDRDTARAWGYHFVENEYTEGPPASGTLDPVRELVLTGEGGSTVPGGAAVPPGGCLGEARGLITVEGGEWGFPQLFSHINGESFTRSMADSRVQEAFQQWSACMAEKGYNQSDPLVELEGAGISLDTPKPSAEEIAMALWDVDCQERTGVTQTWFDIESDIQTTMIEENAEALEQVEWDNEAMVRNAAAAVEELESQ